MNDVFPKFGSISTPQIESIPTGFCPLVDLVKHATHRNRGGKEVPVLGNPESKRHDITNLGG